jgi:hypothetical protein
VSLPFLFLPEFAIPGYGLDQMGSGKKNHRSAAPGFSFLAPSYIILVPKDKKSLLEFRWGASQVASPV